MPTDISFASIVRYWMQANNYSLGNAAKELHCTRACVHNWAHGKTLPTRLRVQSIAGPLGWNGEKLQGIIDRDRQRRKANDSEESV